MAYTIHLLTQRLLMLMCVTAGPLKSVDAVARSLQLLRQCRHSPSEEGIALECLAEAVSLTWLQSRTQILLTDVMVCK